MRFTIKREELLKALGIASRGIASKSPIAVLSNFKLELMKKDYISQVLTMIYP